MSRRREDSIDLACRAWARTRRQVLGLDPPILGREYLGPLRSTLGARRDLHARSRSRPVQQFPEVYTGDALQVNFVFWRLPIEHKDVLDVHYVARAPAVLKYEALGLSRTSYYRQLGAIKRAIETQLGFTPRRNGVKTLPSVSVPRGII